MPSENESITPNESSSGHEIGSDTNADDASLASSVEVSDMDKDVRVTSSLESSKVTTKSEPQTSAPQQDRRRSSAVWVG